MRNRPLIVVLWALLCAFGPAAANANLLTNPGFEDDETGWIFAGTFEDIPGLGLFKNVGITVDNLSLRKVAYKNLFGDGLGTISQTVATVPRRFL